MGRQALVQGQRHHFPRSVAQRRLVVGTHEGFAEALEDSRHQLCQRRSHALLENTVPAHGVHGWDTRSSRNHARPLFFLSWTVRPICSSRPRDRFLAQKGFCFQDVMCFMCSRVTSTYLSSSSSRPPIQLLASVFAEASSGVQLSGSTTVDAVMTPALPRACMLARSHSRVLAALLLGSTSTRARYLERCSVSHGARSALGAPLSLADWLSCLFTLLCLYGPFMRNGVCQEAGVLFSAMLGGTILCVRQPAMYRGTVSVEKCDGAGAARCRRVQMVLRRYPAWVLHSSPRRDP